MENNISSGQCSVCGITFTKTGDTTCFYWSYTGKAATPDEVSSKVCQYAKKPGCANTAGQYVKGLGWGESVQEQLISAWWGKETATE